MNQLFFATKLLLILKANSHLTDRCRQCQQPLLWQMPIQHAGNKHRSMATDANGANVSVSVCCLSMSVCAVRTGLNRFPPELQNLFFFLLTSDVWYKDTVTRKITLGWNTESVAGIQDVVENEMCKMCKWRCLEQD